MVADAEYDSSGSRWLYRCISSEKEYVEEDFPGEGAYGREEAFAVSNASKGVLKLALKLFGTTR